MLTFSLFNLYDIRLVLSTLQKSQNATVIRVNTAPHAKMDLIPTSVSVSVDIQERTVKLVVFAFI